MPTRNREYYFEELKKRAEGEIKLAEMNLKLLSTKEKKLLDELETVTASKGEWESIKEDEERKLANPEPILCRMLTRDFQSEISERRRGGNPELVSRFGEPQFGVKFQRGEKRKISYPRLKTADGRSWYEKTEEEVQQERNNSEAFLKWDRYMGIGLEISEDWNFNKLVSEIQKFFQGAPELNVFGESYEVFVSSGERYESRKE